MPQVQLIPPPTVEYEYDITWPAFNAGFGIGSTFVTNAHDKYGSEGNKAIWAAAGGTGLTQMNLRDNVMVGRFAENAGNGVNRVWTGISMYPALLSANLPTGFILPASQRVFRISWLMALTGNLTDESGLHINAAIASNPGFRNYYFGVQGDGAGGWEYESNRTGGGAAAETIALGAGQGIADPTRLNAFEIEIQSATSARDAQMRLFINGLVRITRSWGPGTLLPDYAVLLNALRFSGVVAVGALPLGGQLDIGFLRWRFGRYTFDGLEII